MTLVLEAAPAATNELRVRQTQSKKRNSAIVIGSGMAGLAAARVLSDHYSEVLVVDRNRLDECADEPWGVPHGGHTHWLLASGKMRWENFFPGLFDQIVKAGAVKADINRDCHWCFSGCEHARFKSGLETVLGSRALLENNVRERLHNVSNVRFRKGCYVRGLAANFNDARRVIGIRTDGGTLFADLVVDATGQDSRSPQWLAALGYEPPKQETIEVNLGYATRQFRRSIDDLNGHLLASIAATAQTRRSGIMLAQERDRWSVTLSSYGGDAPTEISDFRDFAKTLQAPYIYDVISEAEPIGEAQPGRFRANVRNRYELLHRFPKGYLVFGDAISCFNPVCGQGTAVAALQAVELDKALRANCTNLSERFFAQAATIIDAAWSTASRNEFRVPGVAGPSTMMSRLLDWYLTELHVSAQTDHIVASAFQDVTNLLKAPQTLVHLPIALRVLSAAFARHAARNRASRLEAAARGAF